MSDPLPPIADSPEAVPDSAPDKRNPLLDLTESQKEDLFVYLREGADDEVINEKLAELGCPASTRRHIDQFFKIFAQERWTKRVDRAAQEAEALGQEAFRQIASGKVEPDALAKYTSLFLRAKEQDRAERALLIQGERLRVSQRNATEKALDSFARNLPKNPAALEAFKKLKDQLLDDTTHLEEAQ